MPEPLLRVTHTPPAKEATRLVVCLGLAITTGLLSGTWKPAGYLAAFAVAGMLIFAIRLVAARPYPKAFLEVHDDGVLVYSHEQHPARLVRWALIRDIRGESPDSERGNRRAISFELAGTTWRVVCPDGVGDPTQLALTIAALRPADQPPESPDEPLHRLESAFGFRLPEGATLLDAECFPDGTGRWTIAMPEPIFRELRSKTLRCSAWYPLPPAMRFLIGGKRGRAGAPDPALYAIGLDDAESTAVLVRDPRTERLLCLRTADMA